MYVMASQNIKISNNSVHVHYGITNVKISNMRTCTLCSKYQNICVHVPQMSKYQNYMYMYLRLCPMSKYRCIWNRKNSKIYINGKNSQEKIYDAHRYHNKDMES